MLISLSHPSGGRPVYCLRFPLEMCRRISRESNMQRVIVRLVATGATGATGTTPWGSASCRCFCCCLEVLVTFDGPPASCRCFCCCLEVLATFDGPPASSRCFCSRLLLLVNCGDSEVGPMVTKRFVVAMHSWPVALGFVFVTVSYHRAHGLVARLKV
ncbi:hypothetical protein BC826DRAFT_222141 [Russula brevipes]|nr:hypothetical protein BC826DRAFT_222141 [Russula brevipes]